MTNVGLALLQIALVIPAIVCHEVAHGYVSYLLGDPTAKSAGRLSLNPIRHVDPFGTVFLPLMLTVLGGPVFGFAKPVPINPGYYRDYRKGMFLTGLAGPATNLIFALLGAIVVRVSLALAPLSALTGVIQWAFLAGYYFAYVNLVLMFFNLILMPPLDGSRVLPLFLSDKALARYHEFERYGLVIFFVVLLILPDFIGVDLIGAYFSITVDPILDLLTGLTF